MTSWRAALLALVTLLAAPDASRAADAVTLRLDWTTLGYHLPFYLGAADGTYKKAGLDLTIEEGRGSSNTITLVGNNSDDFGFADATTAARLIGQGLPVKVVMGILQRSTLSLFFPAGTLKTPADLKGKRISMCAGDGLIVYLPAYLKAVGLSMGDVEIVTVDCSVKYTVVAQGRADAVASYGVAGRPLMAAVGIREVGKFDFADAGLVLPSFGIVASREAIARRGALIARFVAATAEAWKAARDKPDAAVAATVTARPLLKGKEASLRDAFLDCLQYVSTPALAERPFGWQSPADWDRAVDTLVEVAAMKRPASSAEMFTNDFVKAP